MQFEKTEGNIVRKKNEQNNKKTRQPDCRKTWIYRSVADWLLKPCVGQVRVLSYRFMLASCLQAAFMDCIAALHRHSKSFMIIITTQAILNGCHEGGCRL